MSWLEPIMWRLQRWLYSKTLLTLCPSPSTQAMLEAQSFSGVRLWPRGVDVSHFGPNKRSVQMRARWGVGNALAHAGVAATSKATFSSTNIGVDVGVSVSAPKTQDAGVHYQGRKTSLPLTPPATPLVAAVGQTQAPDRALPTTNSPLPIPLPSYAAVGLPDRVVLLYVGRISWEKNLHLLLAAYAHLPNLLPAGSGLPKLVFVGDGPARTELESLCGKRGWDAEFMGYQSGEMLAECYASGDVFAFPSFTETFGQVVLEALASGLPVVGLDAEGTRDLVKMGETGLLLSLPAAAPSWPTACRPGSPYFELTARGYAGLLARAVLDHNGRREMSVKAATEGVKGFTWWDAMERCVDGYRESLRLAREKRKVDVVCHEVEEGSSSLQTPSSRRVSRVNRVVSRRLAKGPWDSDDTSERLWHLKNVLKAFVAIWMFWAIYSRHHMSLRSVEVDH
nr:lycosyl transferases group 1 protein [Naematelia aurantialba]